MARTVPVLARAEAAMVRRTLGKRPGPRGVRLEASLEAGTDTLPQIKHIVVLMIENHSFDSYLGTFKKDSRPGLRSEDVFSVGPDGKPANTNPGRQDHPVPVRATPSSRQTHGLPGQSWRDSHMQWHEGACDGFVRSAQDIEDVFPDAERDPGVVMRYWTEADLPFYYGLARTFPLAARWFSSCLGPTFPNRRFLIAWDGPRADR